MEPWEFTSDIKGGGAGLLLFLLLLKNKFYLLFVMTMVVFSYCHNNWLQKTFCGSVLSPVREGLHSVTLGVLGKNLASTVVLMDLASE